MKAIRWISPLFTFCQLWLHFSHSLPALLTARVVPCPGSWFRAEMGAWWGRGAELGAERAHLLIVNRTELTDLGSTTASTHGTELRVLKSTRLVELSVSLADMNDLLLLLPELPGLGDDGGVLGPLHGAELVPWLPTTRKLSTWLAACRTELLVWLSTKLTFLSTKLSTMLPSVLSTMLSTLLSTMLSTMLPTMLPTMLSTMLSTMLPTMLSRVELSHLLN